ncbi:MAG: hypothetical protein R3F17_03130 [Planctomycetota bacterium]
MLRFAVLLLALLQAPVFAFEDCRYCEDVGMVRCGEHDPELADMEDQVLFCSVAARCPACGGTFWVDCERCDNDTKHAEVAARRKAIAEWAGPYEMEGFIGHAVPMVETEHFELVVNTGTLKEDKQGSTSTR